MSVAAAAPLSEVRATENVVLVTLDGVRWQEVFRGADPLLLDEEHGAVEDLTAVRAQFWREDLGERRAALMPFLWSKVASAGQILGNADRGSVVRVTNGLSFSYPGYNEILTGFADPRVDSNDERPNPNVTVLEWLNRRDPWRGRVAAFTSWNCFTAIINEGRSGVFVNAGNEAVLDAPLAVEVATVNALMREVLVPWKGVRHDAFTQILALEHFERARPRVFYIAFDETDEYAHDGRYDRLLGAIHRIDAYLAALWQTIERLEGYRGKTTLVVTTDHGRGDAPSEWKNHGQKVAGAERIWIAALGPDTPAAGERRDVETLEQNQIAATLAAFLGVEYRADVPRAGAPIALLLR